MRNRFVRLLCALCVSVVNNSSNPDDDDAQLLGRMGYAQEYHVERYLRESLIPRIAPVSPLRLSWKSKGWCR